MPKKLNISRPNMFEPNDMLICLLCRPICMGVELFILGKLNERFF